MPKSFSDCIKNGGKVKTKNLKNNKYIRICYDKNGKSHAGEVMTRKKGKELKANKQRRQVNDARKLANSLLALQKHFNSFR